MKSGDIIKVTEKNIKLLAGCVESIKTADFAFKTASINIRQARDDLWKTVVELYPEADNYNVTYDWETNELLVRSGK